jgi:putative sterol carrier protein
MKNVSLDEQRHIGFGVKVLSELIAEDPECKDAVADLLSEVMVFTIGVLQPPNWDRRYTECFGFTLEDIYAEGFASFETKMRTAGLPLEEIQYALPIPLELDQKARAERAIKLLEAGYAGEKNGPPARDHESMELLFDSIQRSARTDLAPDAMTIQWDFSDAEPWYLRIDNGSTSTESGRAPSPDVTLSCRFDDWVDVIAAREDPRKQMLKRKIRPKGGLRALYRMSKVFPR